MKNQPKNNQSGIMRDDLYQELFEMEKDHWWHVSKRANVRTLLEKYLKADLGGEILDVGCGTGLMLEELKKFGEPVGIDPYSEALDFCRQRGLNKLFQAEAARLPLPDNSVKVITALDVLEHIKDQEGALKEFKRVLVPGGLVVITVPAYQRLWSYWDEILGHQRRYNLSSLKKVLEEAGFRVEKVSYTNMLILAPTVLIRKMKKWLFRGKDTSKSDFFKVPRPINYLSIQIYRLERFFLLRSGLPFGLSVVAVARKEK